MPSDIPPLPPSRFERFVDQAGAAVGMPVAYAAKMLGRQQPKYSYAESRLSHGPVMLMQDPAQAKALIGEEEGRYIPAQDPANLSPMSNEVRGQIMKGKAPVVIAPYQEPTSGPAGAKGTEQGVTRHESVHQYLAGVNVSPQRLFSITDKLDPSIKSRVTAQLVKMGYDPADHGPEIASRLAAGQFQSLGLQPQEGEQVWKSWLSEISKTDPAKAKRLDMYTRASHAYILQSGEPTSEQVGQFLPSPK